MGDFRYNDDQFNKLFHSSNDDHDHPNDNTLWLSLPSISWRAYRYQAYVRNYRAAEQEGALLGGQTALFSELDFARRMKRLFDLDTVKDPSDKLVREQARIVDELGMNRLQLYRFADYLRAHATVREQRKLKPADEPALGEQEFLQMKREMLKLQERPALGPTKRAQQLAARLFPGSEGAWDRGSRE